MLNIKEGPLRKRNRRGTWQSRWFVLQPADLRYYESSGSATAKGIIPLTEISGVSRTAVMDREPFCFGVRCRDRTYTISAQSEEAARDWCSAIYSAQQALAAELRSIRMAEAAPPPVAGSSRAVTGTRAAASMSGPGEVLVAAPQRAAPHLVISVGVIGDGSGQVDSPSAVQYALQGVLRQLGLPNVLDIHSVPIDAPPPAVPASHDEGAREIGRAHV